jgi:peroxiredoxin Q/BCP
VIRLLISKQPRSGGIYGGGQEVKHADVAGSTLAQYFYPKDDRPVCTAQACDLRDSWRELQSKLELFGVSTDSVESHQKFIKKHGLPFPLLSDPDQEMVKAIRCGLRKACTGEIHGNTKDHLHHRPRKKIKTILKKVKPAEHVTVLLKALACRPEDA